MSSVPRFFVSPDAVSESVIALPPDAVHHARNVLRLRAGEAIVVHDNTGRAYDCVLEERGKTLLARVESVGTAASEPQTRLTVAQALPKTSDKIEQVLQHGTEVGATGFVFWASIRSVARLADGEKIEKRLARWRGIIQGASEQSGRGILPDVSWQEGASGKLVGLFPDYNRVFVLHESARITLKAALADTPPNDFRLLLVVGPEGGLTDEEVSLFVQQGAISITLGSRVLRTETAALVALSQILYARESETGV